MERKNFFLEGLTILMALSLLLAPQNNAVAGPITNSTVGVKWFA